MKAKICYQCGGDAYPVTIATFYYFYNGYVCSMCGRMFPDFNEKYSRKNKKRRHYAGKYFQREGK